ncbi:MAG TPA: dockerin type I domain-containing protein, partial [Candidatus Nanoarchaeia archaeon]|nr:dockerin type I domain-containing protein [Candidatus Nanoarchaeia archaeon]
PPPPPPAPVPIVGDINGDGKVDDADLAILINNWLTTNAAADINHSGLVDIYDFSKLLKDWSH